MIPEITERAMPEAPSARTLGKACATAVLAAAVILVVAVLPAEYGIDPLGTGRALGFSALSRPVATLHNRNVRSVPAEASIVPSGEKATDQMASLCPVRTARCSRLVAFQRRMVSSALPVASVLESGENAEDQQRSHQ